MTPDELLTDYTIKGKVLEILTGKTLDELIERYKSKAPDSPRCEHGVLSKEDCFKCTPIETSGYSTNKDELEWAHDETGHLCKVTKVFNPEPKVWLQRAKENIVKCNYDKATKCINEAIELIYGKAE